MKPRDLWLLPAAVFPYWVLIVVRLMRKGVFGVLYENAAPPVLVSSGCVALAGILGSLVWIVVCVRRGSSARDMLKTMLPVGADLFVRLAFKAARKYPKECRQTRLDIDHRILKAIREWKDQA